MKWLYNFFKFDYWLKESILDSFILINKASNKTSHDEVFILRKILKIKKIGHSGTLDPKVTGLLVCGIGKTTRILEYLLLSSKGYVSTFELHQKIERDIFEKNLENFLGKIKQLPPQKSAVKREERQREVYKIEVLDYDKNLRWVKLYLEVERGTYIRKLAHDIGQKIGVNISMGYLKRIKVGVFNNKDNWIQVNKLEKIYQKFQSSYYFKWYYFLKIKKYFYSPEILFQRENKFQIIKLKKESLRYIKNGANVRLKNIIKNKEFDFQKIPVCFFKNKLICVGDWIKKNKIYEMDTETEIINLKKVF